MMLECSIIKSVFSVETVNGLLLLSEQEIENEYTCITC